MENDNITPIHHGALSSVGGTAAGAVGGGLKAGAKTVLAVAAIGALVGGLWGLGVLGAIGGAMGISGGTVISTIFGVGLGGVLGGALGLFASPATATIGAVRGGNRAANRIRDEKGAATVLDAQLSAYQAQAYAAQQQPATIYAPSASNNTTISPGAGAPVSQYPTMNQASPRINADSAQNLGTINGLQLQRA